MDAFEADSGLRALRRHKPLTVHAWGGACLGPDAGHGVVDHRGEIYGNPGLFVADAAALPAAVGTPPSLAIAAWAHHVADQLANSIAGRSDPSAVEPSTEGARLMAELSERARQVRKTIMDHTRGEGVVPTSAALCRELDLSPETSPRSSRPSRPQLLSRGKTPPTPD